MVEESNRYFSLNPETVINRGKNRTLFYNLLTHDNLILENSKLPDKFNTSINLEDYKNSMDIIEKLKKLGFGQYYNTKHHIEPIITQKDSTMRIDILNEFKLRRISIEITSKCSLDCQFCEPSSLGYSSCMCKRWLKDDDMDERWISIIDSAINLGLEECFICGGDPLLKMDILIRILDHLNKNNIKAVILTNGSLINRMFCQKISKYDVTISLQVFSNESESFSKITQSGTFFNNYTSALKLLKEYRIPLIVSLIVSKLNEAEIQSLENEFSDFPIQKIYLYPNNRFSSGTYYKDMISNKGRQFDIDIYSYPFVKNFNNCLSNQISISSDGIVYPCMMLKQFPIGDLNKEELWKIFFEKRHEPFWKLPKRKIDHCDDCELNLICFDCRAIGVANTELISSNEYCNY